MKPRVVVPFLIVLVLSLGYYKYHLWQQHSAIQTAFEYGRLAPLPGTATEVQVDTEGSMFSRTFWACFKADSAVIAKWAAQSSSLSKQLPVVLPATGSLVEDGPNWFTPQIISQGVRFDIPSNKEQLYGTVWIDYASGTLYIKTSHS